MVSFESPADLALQTPSPVLPTWLPARRHPAAEVWIRTHSSNDSNSDIDIVSDSDSDFGEDLENIANARGPCCRCLHEMRPSRQPFPSFLLPSEVDEDLCPACEAAQSMIVSAADFVHEIRPDSPDAVLRSPAEVFWR